MHFFNDLNSVKHPNHLPLQKPSSPAIRTNLWAATCYHLLLKCSRSSGTFPPLTVAFGILIIAKVMLHHNSISLWSQQTSNHSTISASTKVSQVWPSTSFTISNRTEAVIKQKHISCVFGKIGTWHIAIPISAFLMAGESLKPSPVTLLPTPASPNNSAFHYPMLLLLVVVTNQFIIWPTPAPSACSSHFHLSYLQQHIMVHIGIHLLHVGLFVVLYYNNDKCERLLFNWKRRPPI